MAERQLPSIDLLRQLLRYEPETGNLFWKERPVEMFEPKGRGAQGNANTWNSRHAGKQAFITKHEGYLRGAVFAINIIAHRVAWAMHYGEWPSDCIDHVNGDGTNNGSG